MAKGAERMKIKRNKVDDIFSKLVRERVNYTCEACGKEYPEGSNRMGVHCSHIFSRRHTRTRHDPDNAVCHCFGCHNRLGGDPVEFTRWAEKHLGEGLLEIVREKAHSICKLTKVDKEEQYKHLKAEYLSMMDKRNGGETGRIEFDGWL